LSSGELQINRPVCYLDQHFGLLSPELSMLENMLEHCAGMLENDARTLLAGIGFRRDSVFRQASQLSGGEKMKLAMLIVSHQPESPLLLLDEPDNHLDLDSKLLLADALRNYQGAFVIVSHDMDFVAESGVTQSYLLESA
jgi:ATPase subunit of ABC transporter with duplicated ATPase domains